MAKPRLLQQLATSELHWDAIGYWPPVTKIFIATVVFLTVLLAGYLLDTMRLQATWMREQTAETRLKQTFTGRVTQTGTADTYRQQLAAAQLLLFELSGQTNTLPTLLDQISKQSAVHGLTVERLTQNSDNTVANTTAGVLPDIDVFTIEMTLLGDYHALGAFVSDIAALSPWIAWHDFDIYRHDSGSLAMHLVAAIQGR